MVHMQRLYVCCAEFVTLNHLKPSVSANDQAQTVIDLISRNIGQRVADFNVSVSADIGVAGKDTFKVNALHLLQHLTSCVLS